MTVDNINEKNLLMQVASGNTEAFGSLFNIYRPKLYTNIYRLTNSREIAEDTVHDVFLQVWMKRDILPGIDNFGAYLKKVAHNLAYSGFRRAAKETLILAEIRKQQSEQIADEPVIAAEIKAFIQRAVNHLTPQQKQVFLLSREENMKQEEIARHLDISVLTVKKHMVMALKQLREEISRVYGPYAIAIYIIYGL